MALYVTPSYKLPRNEEDTMRTKNLLLLLALCLVTVAAPVNQAYASPPTIIPLHVDETIPAGGMSNFCGFTIMRHDQADGRLIIRHTNNGDEVDLDIQHGTMTFSANGHSLDGIYTGFDRETFYSDGSYNYLGVGTGFYVVLPGEGPVWGQTGSLTFTLDPDGNVISERETQHFLNRTSTAVCEALAP
jgi:hypothetical protein